MNSSIATFTLFVFSISITNSQSLDDCWLVEATKRDTCWFREAVKAAPYIFEGTVIATEYYWNHAHNKIFTSNIVKVDQVFIAHIDTITDGGSRVIVDSAFFNIDTVEIVTRGGMVNDKIHSISHALGFYIGQKGMFFAETTSRPQNKNTHVEERPLLEEFNEFFVAYYYNGNNPPAVFRTFKFDCREQVRTFILYQKMINCLDLENTESDY